MPTDAEWLALCCRSETSLSHEWPYVAWVVRNRVEDGGGRYPDTYREVVLQPKQFSFFNDRDEGLADSDLYRTASSGWDMGSAVHCAEWVLSVPRGHAPIPSDCLWFWSPRSMVPEGRVPTWARRMERFVPPGIDPIRFVFARKPW